MNLIKILNKFFSQIGEKICKLLKKFKRHKNKPFKKNDDLMKQILLFDKEMLFKIGLLLLEEKRKYLAILFFEIAHYKKSDEAKPYLISIYRSIGDKRRSYKILKESTDYFLIGFYLQNGIGCKKNIRKAIYFFKKSFFKQNNSKSALFLGSIYFKLKYYRRAIFYFEIAAKMGEGGAYNNLGICYLKGIFYKKNTALAFENFKRATELSFKFSFYDLAKCYEGGIGTEKNNKLARKYYQKSKNVGDERVEKIIIQNK